MIELENITKKYGNNRQRFFHYMMEDYEKHPRLFLLSTHLIHESVR